MSDGGLFHVRGVVTGLGGGPQTKPVDLSCEQWLECNETPTSNLLMAFRHCKCTKRQRTLATAMGRRLMYICYAALYILWFNIGYY